METSSHVPTAANAVRHGLAGTRHVPKEAQEALKQIEAEIREIVNDSAQFAQDSPEPHPDELWTDVLVESH